MLLPAGRTDSYGPDACELAADAGLILDDWQAWCLEHGLSVRADGKWCGFECCVVVPRQNGKGAIFEALALYHLFVLKTELTVYSAHEFKTAGEFFIRLRSLIEGNPDLAAATKAVHTANGKEAIETIHGSRLKIVARSKGSLRGFSADLLILDEAYQLPQHVIGAIYPTTSARPNPQIWFGSSAPHSDSLVLHDLLERMDSARYPRTFIAEWGLPRGTEGTPENIARVNPGFPHRLTQDNLDAEKPTLIAAGLEEYERERLGIRSIPEGSEPGLIRPEQWAAVCDDALELDMDASTLLFGIDVAETRNHAAIVALHDRQFEWVDYREGTFWLVDRCKELAGKYRKPFALDSRGPAGTFIRPLRDAGIEVKEVAGDQLVKATGEFYDAVVDKTIRCRTHQDIDRAVLGAAKRDVGDAFVWTRKNSHAEISFLVAMTVALYSEFDPASQVF